jgi:hypothetical protein
MVDEQSHPYNISILILMERVYFKFIKKFTKLNIFVLTSFQNNVRNQPIKEETSHTLAFEDLLNSNRIR